MKTAGVVVTFNRKEELAKNVESILNQSYCLERYYIIDNHGTDNSKEYLKEKNLLDNDIVKYVYLEKNIGGSGGFYTGMKMAYDDGFDFICLMDDDGRPKDKNMLENLMSQAIKIHCNKKEILINSLVTYDENILSFGLNGGINTVDEANLKSQNNIIKNTINPFNGTLASRELIDKIGFPNKEFFIKGDEDDYYRRALKSNAFVGTVCDSLYYHPILERKTFNFFGIKKKGSTESPWKEYYRARNYTYMFKREGEHKKYIKQNCRQIYLALKFNKDKKNTIKMIIKGFFDGYRGILGPTVKP